MKLSTFRFSHTFRFATWMALWVMLFPVFLPLLHHQAAMPMQTQPICHMAGMGGGEQQPTPDHQKSKPSCPICQSLNNLAQGFITPAVVALAAFQSRQADFVAHRQVSANGQIYTSSWPRAPPAFA